MAATKDTRTNRFGDNLPIVHKEFASLGTEKQQVRLRIVQFQHPEIGISDHMLDIRRYLKDKVIGEGKVYSGWTNVAHSLRLKDVIKLANLLEEIIPCMQELEEKGKE